MAKKQVYTNLILFSMSLVITFILATTLTTTPINYGDAITLRHTSSGVYLLKADGPGGGGNWNALRGSKTVSADDTSQWFVQKPLDNVRFATTANLGTAVKSGDIIRLENVSAQGLNKGAGTGWFLTLNKEVPQIQISGHATQSWDHVSSWYRIYKCGGAVGDVVSQEDIIYLVSFTFTDSNPIPIPVFAGSDGTSVSTYLGLRDSTPTNWENGQYFWSIESVSPEAYKNSKDVTPLYSGYDNNGGPNTDYAQRYFAGNPSAYQWKFPTPAHAAAGTVVKYGDAIVLKHAKYGFFIQKTPTPAGWTRDGLRLSLYGSLVDNNSSQWFVEKPDDYLRFAKSENLSKNVNCGDIIRLESVAYQNTMDVGGSSSRGRWLEFCTYAGFTPLAAHAPENFSGYTVVPNPPAIPYFSTHVSSCPDDSGNDTYRECLYRIYKQGAAVGEAIKQGDGIYLVAMHMPDATPMLLGSANYDYAGGKEVFTYWNGTKYALSGWPDNFIWNIDSVVPEAYKTVLKQEVTATCPFTADVFKTVNSWPGPEEVRLMVDKEAAAAVIANNESQINGLKAAVLGNIGESDWNFSTADKAAKAAMLRTANFAMGFEHCRQNEVADVDSVAAFCRDVMKRDFIRGAKLLKSFFNDGSGRALLKINKIKSNVAGYAVMMNNIDHWIGDFVAAKAAFATNLPVTLDAINNHVVEDAICAVLQAYYLQAAPLTQELKDIVSTSEAVKLANLSPVQIKALPADQVANLNIVSPDVIKALSGEQLGSLLEGRISALSSDQLRAITPVQILSLVATDKLKNFTQDQMKLLQKDPITYTVYSTAGKAAQAVIDFVSLPQYVDSSVRFDSYWNVLRASLGDNVGSDFDTGTKFWKILLDPNVNQVSYFCQRQLSADGGVPLKDFLKTPMWQKSSFDPGSFWARLDQAFPYSAGVFFKEHVDAVSALIQAYILLPDKGLPSKKSTFMEELNSIIAAADKVVADRAAADKAAQLQKVLQDNTTAILSLSLESYASASEAAQIVLDLQKNEPNGLGNLRCLMQLCQKIISLDMPVAQVKSFLQSFATPVANLIDLVSRDFSSLDAAAQESAINNCITALAANGYTYNSIKTQLDASGVVKANPASQSYIKAVNAMLQAYIKQNAPPWVFDLGFINTAVTAQQLLQQINALMSNNYS